MAYQKNDDISWVQSFFSNFPKLKQINDSSENCTNRIYKNSCYFGEIINAKRHGYGLLKSNQAYYIGYWQSDMKHGEGQEVFENGDQYHGSYVNGKQEGQGTYIWNQTKDIYQGEWQQGMKHGWGIYKGKKVLYEGNWQFGQANGYGTLQQNGKYQGQFYKNLKQGQGKEWFQNGDYYEGDYLNGKPEGRGIYVWKDKTRYEGQFINGLRHGQGEQVDQNCTYTGEFLNDKKSGKGIQTWQSGTVYRGSFFNDKRQGYGEMYWKDGSYYKGFWKNGMQNGEGELLYEKVIKKGFFQDNKLIEESKQEGEKQDFKISKPYFNKINRSQLKRSFSPEPIKFMINSANERNHLKIPKRQNNYSMIRQRTQNSQIQEMETSNFTIKKRNLKRGKSHLT